MMNDATSQGKKVEQTAEADLAVPKRKHFVSHGHRMHNEITYRIVDWLVNSTVGVAMTYWASRTKSGEKYFGQYVGGAFKKVLSPMFKNEENLMKAVEGGKSITSIMAGGFTIIPVMMFLENKKHKKGIIRWLDEKIYGKDTVAKDPKFQEAYDKIDEEPRKGFATGMAARFLALAPIIAITVYPKTHTALTKYLYDPIGKGTQWLAAKAGIKPIRTLEKEIMVKRGNAMVMEKVLPDHSLQMPANGKSAPPGDVLSNWDFLHRNIGFDFGLTIFYAVLHEIAYKTLAKKRADSVKKEAAGYAHSGHSTPEAAPAASVEEPQTATSFASSVGGPKAGTRRPEKAADHVGGIDARRTMPEAAVQI